MSARRLLPVLLLGGGLILAGQLPRPCLAQDNPTATSNQTNVDAPDCPNVVIFPKLSTSVVVSCQSGKSVAVNMPLQPDAQGRAREKSVRGVYEYREYRITLAIPQEQSFDSLMQLIPMAGFTVKYFAKPSVITARSGDTWILLNVSEDSYNLSVVREIPESWTPVKTAEDIAREMQIHHSVPIYGIQFAPENQTIQENGSPILNEVLKYLKQNPNLVVIVETHKVSPSGTPENDFKITADRADSLVAWLLGHGVAAGRLQSKPYGRTKPLTENDTPLEMQRNERIALTLPTS